MTQRVLSTMTMALISSPHSETGSLPGILLAALAFALLTSVDTIFKLVAVGHPAYQILVGNGCFALIPIFTWTALTGGLRRLSTRRLPQHLARGSISVCSAFMGIYAYSRLPLTDYYAILFAGPLLVTAMSSLWLREKIDSQRWLAIIVGFIGVLIVANPFDTTSGGLDSMASDAMTKGRLAACGAVFCYALSVVIIRHMRAGETNITFSLYGYVASISISGCLWLLHPGDAPPLAVSDIAHLALSGLLAGIASICLMTAYHRTPASLVAPFQYTQIIWGAVAGYALWQHLPDLNLVVGATVVAASGLFVIYNEMRLKEKGRRPAHLHFTHSDDCIEAAKSE